VTHPTLPCVFTTRRGRFGARGAASLLLALAALSLFGCGTDRSGSESPGPPARNSIFFRNVTESAGIRFVHNSGAYGRKFLPETMGSGLAFLDFDGDSRPDLFFLNGTDWPDHHRRATTPALYRNRGDGTFEDTTVRAGLSVEVYGIGLAAADYDNDGDTDLFIDALGPDRLFRNRGDGTFEDVTRQAGVSDPAFGSSAT
jgi:hypothetical protein